MMIVDLSQIAIASLMVQTQAWKPGARVDLNIDLLRHIVLKGLKDAIAPHKREYGDIIIACDCGKSWRKVAFQYYKYKRAEGKAAYAIDWTAFYTFLNELIEEIRDNFPYTVISVPHAEGDDIIGTIVRWYQQNQLLEPIMIVSGDKDFKQLHNERTRQYSPILRKFVGTRDAALELKEHIIKGDRNDGVPNILSNDDCLATGDRQKKITAGRLALHMEMDPSEYPTTVQRNWHRNELMISLEKTPQRLKDQIIETFQDQINNPTKNNVFNYLFNKGLKELQLAAGDF
jgi:hypothetical protein